MPIDDEFLRCLRRYEDPETGVSEEFLESSLGTGGGLGILSRPLGPQHDTGWVLCPSLGSEEANLRRLEGMVARKLAAQGFPAIRIRRGVKSAQTETPELRLAARLNEIEHAAGWLLSKGGVSRVGLLGALFGGAVAALACERLRFDFMGLWEPVSRGQQYLRKTLRFRMISGLLQTGEGAQPDRGPDPREELAERGSTIVRGLRLTSEAYDEIAAVDLTKDVRAFRGHALLVGISTNGEPSAGLRRLAGHLERLGAAVVVDVLPDPLAVPFGEHYYRNVGTVRIDTRLELDQKIAAATARWATRSVTEPVSFAAR